MLTALVKDTRVISVIEGEPPEGWEAPDDCIPVPIPEGVEVTGDETTYVDGVFSSKETPPPPMTDEMRSEMLPLSPRQFRLGFLKAGHAPSQIEAVIEATPDGPDKEAARIEWEFAREFERLHPLVVSLSTSLGFTAEQVDEMWTTALAL
ncbi:hypothetical protein ACQU0X_08530 [Pseudovibrio ascidiaceicola]|uniref:hypothetical protein n=1 Tax=Pseudovibrio ascidiaceicola TaxID=285279 RepID=UPI003D360797